jgi:hypothetical protein
MSTGPQEEFFTPRRFALLLALALGVLFFRVLVGGETFYYRDFGVLAVPTATFHKTSMLAGEIPFWNPYSNCGAPFLAQWGTMVLYPLSLIYVLLPMPWSLNFFCVVHLWLGGMGMYFLAKRWCGGTWPAAVAGTAFTFNGITLAALAWPNYVAAIGLFPWVLLTAERAWNPARIPPTLLSPMDRSASGAIICAAFVATLQLLTGVPELSVLTWIVVTVLWALELVTQPQLGGAMVRRLLAVIAATAGLLCIQLLPFYELLQNSHRAPGFTAEAWSLTFSGLGNLVLPRLRTLVTPEGTAFQYEQFFLSSVYLGAPLLVLALISWRTGNRRARVLGVLAVLALVLALGSRGFLYSFLTSLFPPLSIARFPVKFMFLVAFTAPLLAGFGVQYFAELTSERRRKILLVSGAAIAVIFAALLAFNHARPLQYDRLNELRSNSLVRAGIVAAMLVVFHFAFAAGRKGWIASGLFLILFLVDAKSHLRLNPTLRASIFTGNFWKDAHKIEKPSPGHGRIFISKEAEARLFHSDVVDPEKDLVGKRMAEWSHLNLLDAVPKVNGSSTLQIREQAVLQSALYSGTNAQLEAWLDFLNVRYWTSSNSVVQWEPRTHYAPFVTAGQMPIFESINPLEKPFDFRTHAAIHSLVSNSAGVQRADVQITNLVVRANEVRFEASATAPAVAVVAQTWFPSWKAEITTERGSTVTPVLRANLACQAVLLPAGPSRVRLFYDDHSFKLGAALSGATLLLCALGWVREKKNTLLKNEKSVR